MIRRSVLLAITILTLASCGGATAVGTQYQTLTNPEADFGAMTTVAFELGELPTEYEPVDFPEEYRETAGAAVREELDRLGWTLVESSDDADLVVYAAAGRRTQEMRAQGQVGCCQGDFSFGGDVAGMDKELTSDALIFEAYDRDGNEVWYGHAHRAMRNTVNANAFGRIVRRLFANFPRAGTAVTATTVEAPEEPAEPVEPAEE
jgi:hypothetical protein